MADYLVRPFTRAVTKPRSRANLSVIYGLRIRRGRDAKHE